VDDKNLTISEAARLLGVSAQTLRRWDKAGVLQNNRINETGFRYYSESDLEQFVNSRQLDLEKIAERWVIDNGTWHPLRSLYCSSSQIFQLRLY